MNYDEPRQIQGGPNEGRWHYTSANRRTGTHAIGYCAEGCEGHDTAEDAVEHYRQWQLDHVDYLPFSLDSSTRHRCQDAGCTSFTTGTARLPPDGMISWFLCEFHRNRESLELLYPMASYRSAHS